MPRVQRAYRASALVLSPLLLGLGLVLLVSTLARGGGPLALGVIVGALFAILGAGRLFLARRPE